MLTIQLSIEGMLNLPSDIESLGIKGAVISLIKP
jgi:hypothetical protein